MRKPLVIGDKTFQYKKDAVLYYREILHKYSVGQSVNKKDFDDLLDLLDYDASFYVDDDFKEEETEEIQSEEYFENSVQLRLDLDEKIAPEDIEIIDIKVDSFDYKNKRFMAILNNLETWHFSYLWIINRPKENPDRIFITACRDIVRDDIYKVKKKFYSENAKNGLVKCQESNELSKWEDLVVDHRQPNTFSVIVDRFKEINNLDVTQIEYKFTKDDRFVFKNEELNKSFQNYHKQKANLRVVRKELNGSRASMARFKQSTRDLKIE